MVQEVDKKKSFRVNIKTEDDREALILGEAVPIPLPTALRRLIVFGLPKKRFQGAKEKLQTLKHTEIRKSYINDLITDIRNYKLTGEEKNRLNLNRHLDRINELIQQPNVTKWDIRWAAREVKLLKQNIQDDLDISDDDKKNSLANLAEVRAVLGEEFEGRTYKRIKKGGLYVKGKTDYGKLSALYKFFFAYRQIHKTLSVLFTALALVGLTLAILAMLFFPPLAGAATIIIAIASIGICYSSIALVAERFIKWIADRGFFALPFSGAQFLAGVAGFVNIVVSLAFIASGVFALIPGASGALVIPNFPNLGPAINNAINAINKAISTVANFLTINFIAIRTPIDALYITYLIAEMGRGIAFFADLASTLKDIYKNRNMPSKKDVTVKEPETKLAESEVSQQEAQALKQAETAHVELPREQKALQQGMLKASEVSKPTAVEVPLPPAQPQVLPIITKEAPSVAEVLKPTTINVPVQPQEQVQAVKEAQKEAIKKSAEEDGAENFRFFSLKTKNPEPSVAPEKNQDKEKEKTTPPSP